MTTSTVPTWPDSLPAPRFDSYAIQPTATFSRSNMDSGTARQRRRFVSTPKTVTVTWRVTTAQLEIFETFLDDDLYGGALWFQAPMASGAGMKAAQVRFTEPPKITSAGDPAVWDITGTVETMSLRGTTSG